MKVGVLGLGSWPLALAQALNDNGHEVLMWSAILEEVDEFNKNHTASKYIDNVVFDSKMKATTDISEICNHSKIILVGIPTKFYRDVLKTLSTKLDSKKFFINVSKGIEPVTHMLMSEIISEEIDKKYVDDIINLTGPSHAEELVKFMETTLVSASVNLENARLVQSLFQNEYLRVYISDDLIGTQLVGALKNIIAIAAGALVGLGKGDNIKAALITRGLAELRRYALLRGAKEETIYGLAGLGDLIVTTSSVHSRNFQAGYRIGQGENPQNAINNSVMVVEGIRTCNAVVNQLSQLDIEMPISEAVYDVYYNNVDINEAIVRLMTREHRNFGEV
ncbi:MAG: NAD(P)H-dependent glycerol-3-phosphate dehydrogenase [Bacilli bacterium]